MGRIQQVKKAQCIPGRQKACVRVLEVGKGADWSKNREKARVPGAW